MKTRLLLLLHIWASVQLIAQPLQSANPYYVGHSLVNFTMPWFVHSLAQSGAKTSEYASQVMNGASIYSNYQNWASAQGTPYTTALPTGKYDAFIITEAVPLLNHTEWSDTYNAANRFLTYARTHRPNIRYYIYETWHCTNTGRTDTIIPEIAPKKCWYDNNDQLLWQPRLLDDFPKWAKIVDSVRSLQNYNQVYMVPAGQAFYQLSKEIDAGNVPGYRSFRQLFSDDIHPNLAGNYFVACVMYACIFRSSPEGLTNRINNEWGNLWLEVPRAVATIMQKVAWETVCQNAYSGVSCVVTSNNTSHTSDHADILVYPQPASDRLTVHTTDGQPYGYNLFNSMGQLVDKGVLEGKDYQINTVHLPRGIYTLMVQKGTAVVSKKLCIGQ
jgi:hypothetical protein